MQSRAKPLLAALLSLLLLPACDKSGGDTSVEPTAATPEVEEAPRSALGNGRVAGLVRIAANANALPEGCTMQLFVWESDAETLESQRIAQHDIPLAGPAPWAFDVALDQAAFNERNSYAVSVMVVDGAGELWWMMAAPVQAKLADNPDAAVEINLDPGRPEAVAE